MGWLKTLWEKFRGEEPIDFISIMDLPFPGDPTLATAIKANECYIEISVESLRLTWARRFLTKFHGAVYIGAKLARLGSQSLEIAALTKPDKLANLDPSAADNVITLSKSLMGPIAWRGGNLDLELGLFSIKSGNVLTPLLGLVTEISKTAGVSFINQAVPFVPLIRQGLDLIAGQANDAKIEVGLDTSVPLAKSCLCAVVAAKKGSLNEASLSVDPTDRKLLLDGKPLNQAYCVFAIRSVAEKADFGEIPEVKDSFQSLLTAIRSNKLENARDALTAFRLTVIASPDLIPADATRLNKMAEDMVRQAFPAGGTARGITASLPASLSDVDLYTKRR
ncbi:MAG: hypothetical protein WAW96_16830 [Alphaproteobacteria bacterium]